jgi:hypothetical protein
VTAAAAAAVLLFVAGSGTLTSPSSCRHLTKESTPRIQRPGQNVTAPLALPPPRQRAQLFAQHDYGLPLPAAAAATAVLLAAYQQQHCQQRTWSLAPCRPAFPPTAQTARWTARGWARCGTRTAHALHETQQQQQQRQQQDRLGPGYLNGHPCMTAGKQLC